MHIFDPLAGPKRQAEIIPPQNTEDGWQFFTQFLRLPRCQCIGLHPTLADTKANRGHMAAAGCKVKLHIFIDEGQGWLAMEAVVTLRDEIRRVYPDVSEFPRLPPERVAPRRNA